LVEGLTDLIPVLLAYCAVLKARGGRGLDRFPVAMARGKHLFPFRTEQLSPSAPMVLGPQGPGRVGRRRFFASEPQLQRAAGALCVSQPTQARWPTRLGAVGAPDHARTRALAGPVGACRRVRALVARGTPASRGRQRRQAWLVAGRYGSGAPRRGGRRPPHAVARRPPMRAGGSSGLVARAGGRRGVIGLLRREHRVGDLERGLGEAGEDRWEHVFGRYPGWRMEGRGGASERAAASKSPANTPHPRVSGCNGNCSGPVAGRSRAGRGPVAGPSASGRRPRALLGARAVSSSA
jgi:hypothetical protein